MSIARKYGTSLIFRTTGVIDTSSTNNKWKVIFPNDSDGILFDQEDSVFKEDLRNKNKTMYVSKYSSYLYNEDEISIDGDSYSLGFWIAIGQDTLDLFYENKDMIIPIVEWDDGSNIHCSIIIKRVPGTDDPSIALSLGSLVKYIRFFDGLESEKWYHFLYNRNVDTDRAFINGKRVIEYKVNTRTVNAPFFSKIKIGNTSASNKLPPVDYYLDDFFICNSYFYEKDFELPTAYMNNIFPEVEYLEEIESSDENHRLGTSSGMYYKYHTAKQLSPGTYTVGATNSGMMFLNSVYLAPTRWNVRVDNSDPDHPKTVINLTNSEDISVADRIKDSLVFVEICQSRYGNTIAGTNYSITVEQTTASKPNQAKFLVPRPEFARDNIDSFILFDGSLAAVQSHRYNYIKEGSNRYIEFTNKYDQVCNEGAPLTFIFATRATYNTDNKSDQEVNPQLYFKRYNCVVTTPGQCNIPKLVGKAYGRVGFGPESCLFFVNGTWMHPDSFIIKKNVLTMENEKDDTLLAKGSDLTILVFASTKSYNSQNMAAKEFVIRGVSDFDDITSVGITRPSYWKKWDGADYDMYHKLKFYDDIVVPKCNFPTIDKFGIQFKE